MTIEEAQALFDKCKPVEGNGFRNVMMCIELCRRWHDLLTLYGTSDAILAELHKRGYSIDLYHHLKPHHTNLQNDIKSWFTYVSSKTVDWEVEPGRYEQRKVQPALPESLEQEELFKTVGQRIYWHTWSDREYAETFYVQTGFVPNNVDCLQAAYLCNIKDKQGRYYERHNAASYNNFITQYQGIPAFGQSKANMRHM